MKSLSIKNVILKKALKEYKGSYALNSKSDKTNIPLLDENKDLISFLNANIVLTSAQKAFINIFLNPLDNLETHLFSSEEEFLNRLSFINGHTSSVFEHKIGNHWYPMNASIQKMNSIFGSYTQLKLTGLIAARLEYSSKITIGDLNFKDKSGINSIKVTINDMLKSYNTRLVTKQTLAKSNLKKIKKNFIQNMNGKIFDTVGKALYCRTWFGWQIIDLAVNNKSTSLIVEDSLENSNEDDYYDDPTDYAETLPLVRTFSLKHKQYFFVDVDDMKEHVFDKTSIDKLSLIPQIMNPLKSILNNSESPFGDLFQNRHGGLVIMAHGPSGVGKSLSAEVFAEHQERPLYPMEMGEIGTNLADVERSLETIFARAQKWNAVLLFDEADIFLSERSGSDLERSAIVGVFLRLLDYYGGVFFLTTNRGSEIDLAFKSRVTLYLNYPELTNEIRLTIWHNMLEAAKISVLEVDNCNWTNVLEAKPLNGRQIRNMVRLLGLIYPSKKITTLNIIDTLQYTAD